MQRKREGIQANNFRVERIIIFREGKIANQSGANRKPGCGNKMKPFTGSEFSEYFSPSVFTYTLQNLFLSLEGCLK